MRLHSISLVEVKPIFYLTSFLLECEAFLCSHCYDWIEEV